MFEVGFWELALIGVVALLVVGPERLPRLARTVGIYVAKMRRMVAQVKDDIEREVRAEELKESLKETAGLRETYESLNETRKGVEDAADAMSETRAAYESYLSKRDSQPEIGTDKLSPAASEPVTGSPVDTDADQPQFGPQRESSAGLGAGASLRTGSDKGGAGAAATVDPAGGSAESPPGNATPNPTGNASGNTSGETVSEIPDDDGGLAGERRAEP